MSFPGLGRLRRAVRLVRSRWYARHGAATISLFFDFVPPPYGGGNQFLLALKGELARRGVDVGVNYVGPRTRAVLINSMQVDQDFLKGALRPGVRVVHRIDGPISVYRGTGDDAVDREIQRVNREVAHATILQSRYSVEAHRKMGIEFVAPVVIPNAPDPGIFHPPAQPGARGAKLRVISASWSDSPHKGAAVYQWLDRNLDFERVEYTFVGRVKAELQRIRLLPPVPSEPLAELLRAHDVYIGASLNDPCSNALLEALACGLPAIVADSGGSPELVGEGGLTFQQVEQIPGLLERIGADLDGYRSRIRVASLAEVGARYLEVLEGA